LSEQAKELSQTLKKVMHRFGRQSRGQGNVLVKLVRETERHLLALGDPIAAWTEQARVCLHQDRTRSQAQRERLLRDLEATSAAHRHITKQSQRLTQGKKLAHCKIVNAYDPTIAPIVKGKSNCPAQFGRKTGILSEPASGFIFANQVPAGNPSDPSYVLPLLDRVQHAMDQVASPKRLRVISLSGDLGINDIELRQALHARGILTVGIPTSVEPLNPAPSPEEVLDILNASGLNRIRTPHQVQLACASGYSRPVVEGHIATLMARGAGQMRYKGLEGAVIQMGMTVMAHNGAVLVRVSQQHLSKRGQKFRRWLGLKRHNINQINNHKN
jgi:Transposase DDE domain